MNKFRKLTMTLALLIAAVTGAWADEQSESITTRNNDAPGQKTYTGEHFTISGPWADFDGIWITGYNSNMGGSANTVTISSNNGEYITKIEAVVGDTFDWGNTKLATTSGDVTGTYSKGQTITISSVNATTVTLSSPVAGTNMIEFKSWTIYYTPAPTEWDLTSKDGKNWILDKMPANDIVLQVEYFAENNLFLSKEALADKASIAVKAGDLGVQFGNDGKSANPVTEGTAMTVKYNGTKKVIGFKVEKKAPPITVTWNNDDITGSGNSFSKDGVTITAGSIDFDEKNFEENGTFTTTLGNFTKIEVVATNGFCDVSGTGWSGNSEKRTWTGNASSVSFIGDIYGDGNGIKFVFTIEP
jgi:hypothetical protein